MKKNSTNDYEVNELIVIANRLQKETLTIGSNDEKLFEAINNLVYEIAHRMCPELKVPYDMGGPIDLYRSIEMGEESLTKGK